MTQFEVRTNVFKKQFELIAMAAVTALLKLLFLYNENAYTDIHL